MLATILSELSDKAAIAACLARLAKREQMSERLRKAAEVFMDLKRETKQ